MNLFKFLLVLIISNTLFANGSVLKKIFECKGDFIGEISQVCVDSKGRIYIGDFINKKIHQFSHYGKYITSIGRDGMGPGEFQFIWGLQVGPKDSLFVLDGQLNRITIFSTKDFTNYRTIRIPPVINDFYITSLGWLNESLINNGLWLSYDGELLVSYSMPYAPHNLQEEHFVKIYRISRSGKVVGNVPLLKLKADDRLIIKGGGKGFSVSLMPFGQTPVVKMWKNRIIYYGNTDNFEIKGMNLKGEIVRTLKYNIEPVRIKESMWNKVIGDSEYLTKSMLHSSLTPLPENKRIFEEFIIDDKENIWVATNTEDDENYDWLIFNKNNKLIKKFKLINNIILKIIKNNYAYGIYTDNNGIQSVIVYKIN